MGVDPQWGHLRTCSEMSIVAPVCPLMSCLGPRVGTNRHKRGEMGTKVRRTKVFIKCVFSSEKPSASQAKMGVWRIPNRYLLKGKEEKTIYTKEPSNTSVYVGPLRTVLV